MERGEDDRTATFDKNGIPTIELINSCLVVIGVYICNRAACKQAASKRAYPTHLPAFEASIF
jgi:hypothetical protein